MSRVLAIDHMSVDTAQGLPWRLASMRRGRAGDKGLGRVGDARQRNAKHLSERLRSVSRHHKVNIFSEASTNIARLDTHQVEKVRAMHGCVYESCA